MAGKRWNGSSFVDITTKKRWNGSAWVDLVTAKRWTGSAWVNIFPVSVLSFTNADANFTDAYSCDGTSCPLTVNLSDTNTYSISGGTAPYTVSASVASGPAVTINTATPGQITVSTSIGRDAVKQGEIKVTVTDSAGSPNTADFYVPFVFTYTFSIDGRFPPFEPEYPPAEQL